MLKLPLALVFAATALLVTVLVLTRVVPDTAFVVVTGCLTVVFPVGKVVYARVKLPLHSWALQLHLD